MTQQYTCPFCHKNYTQFTIAEHYICGVEPLEDMPMNIAPIPVQEVYPNLSAEKPEDVFPDPLKKAEIQAPKKRGRKPNAKKG